MIEFSNSEVMHINSAHDLLATAGSMAPANLRGPGYTNLLYVWKTARSIWQVALMAAIVGFREVK